MEILTVVPLKKVLFKGELTYFSSKEIPLLTVVEVPFRSKKILGIVINREPVLDTKIDLKRADFHLRKILSIKEKTFIEEEFFTAALATADFFVAQKNNVVNVLLPEILKEEYDKISLYQKVARARLENEPKKLKIEKLLFQAPAEDRLSYYKTLIRGHFANKQSIFIILPTKIDIEYFESVLSRGIEKFTFSFHSEIPPKKMLDKIKATLETDHPLLILGTAPYLSIPRDDIATIIIENESSPAYKTIAKPNIDLRVFAEIFAEKKNARLVLADTLLQFETIARKEFSEVADLRPLSFRINFDGEIKTKSRQKDKELSGKFEIIPKEDFDEIEKYLAKNKKVFIFALRKGLATLTLCRDCGEIVFCEECSSPLVLYVSLDHTKRIFVCNRCGKQENPRLSCKNCSSWDLYALGIGTDTIVEMLRSAFPKTKILKLDKESAKTGSGAQKIIKEFEGASGSILVGTEMALHYMKEKVALSCIASFDSLWSVPNHKMSEKIIHLILSILSKTEKKLIIETKNEKDKAVSSILKDSLAQFVRQEIDLRKELGYPPYKIFIKVSYQGSKEEAPKVKNFLETTFQAYDPIIFGGFVEKVKGKYAVNMLLKISRNSIADNDDPSILNKDLRSLLISLPADFTVQVNPEDLL